MAWLLSLAVGQMMPYICACTLLPATCQPSADLVSSRNAWSFGGLKRWQSLELYG